MATFSEFGFFDFERYVLPDVAAQEQRISGMGAQGLFIVYQEEAQHSDDLPPFLANVLKAVGLDMVSDTWVLPLPTGGSLSTSYLHQQRGFKKVIAFGLSPQRLGLQADMPLYQPCALGLVTYFFADDLSLIYTERQAGKKERAMLLWQGLKAFLAEG